MNPTNITFLSTSMLFIYLAIVSVQPQIECVFIDSTTGEYKLDLTELIGVEGSYQAGFYNYTYFPCSNQYDCRNQYLPSAFASLIQLEQEDSFSDCWWLAQWDNGATQPSYNPTTQTWTFNYAGSRCDVSSSLPRQTVINWRCNPEINGYTITSAAETSLCNYQVNIDSYYACVDAPAPYCKWYGNDASGDDLIFDLTPLSGTTIIGNDRTNSELVFAYTPCRNATQCDNSDVMVKLQNVSTADGCKRYIGIWEDDINGGIPEYDNGIWRFGYNNGETCGEISSELYIYWNCDPNITSYRVDVADVVEPCLYDIYISSSLACV